MRDLIECAFAGGSAGRGHNRVQTALYCVLPASMLRSLHDEVKATAAASPVTVTSTALVLLPPVGQKTSAAANGEPGPFTATQEVMAGSDPVLSGALPDVRPAVSLTGLRRGIQIRSLTPYVMSVTAQGETAADAEVTANAVARSYIQYVVLPAARPGACRRTCLRRPPARPGRRRSCGCLLARCSARSAA